MKLGCISGLSNKALRASPAASNHSSDDSADVTALGRAMDLLDSNMGSLLVVWSGLTASVAIAATAKLQCSVDKVNWDDKASISVAISTAAGHSHVPIDHLHEQFYRVVYTKSDVTGGTISAFLGAKS